MSEGHDDRDQAAVAAVLAASGVTVAPDDVAAVAVALERIQAAAAQLLRHVPLDDTAEGYFRLLDDDRAGEALK